MNSGKSRPYGAPVAGFGDAGPVVPWQPPSRFAQTTRKRSVSIGLPGPTSVSHQSVASRVAGQRMADEHDRAVAHGLVGHLDRRQPRAGLQRKLGQDQPLNHARAARR